MPRLGRFHFVGHRCQICVPPMKGTARVLPRKAGEVTPKAAEGAREMPPLEMCAENKDVRDAPLCHAPSTMLRMVPLVTYLPPHLLLLPMRWREGDRVPTGTPSPRGSRGPRPPFHRPRTVAWAAKDEARFDKDGRGWICVSLASTFRRTGSTCMSCRRARVFVAP